MEIARPIWAFPSLSTNTLSSPGADLTLRNDLSGSILEGKLKRDYFLLIIAHSSPLKSELTVVLI